MTCDILDSLTGTGDLTWREMEYIVDPSSGEKDTSAKTEVLLDVICRSDYRTFNAFIRQLRKASQRQVANILEEGGGMWKINVCKNIIQLFDIFNIFLPFFLLVNHY